MFYFITCKYQIYPKPLSSAHRTAHLQPAARSALHRNQPAASVAQRIAYRAAHHSPAPPTCSAHLLCASLSFGLVCGFTCSTYHYCCFALCARVRKGHIVKSTGQELCMVRQDRVCFFVSCDRNWFNRDPGANLGIARIWGLPLCSPPES